MFEIAMDVTDCERAVSHVCLGRVSCATTYSAPILGFLPPAALPVSQLDRSAREQRAIHASLLVITAPGCWRASPMV